MTVRQKDMAPRSRPRKPRKIAKKRYDSAQKIKYNKSIITGGLRVISEEIPNNESFALGICVNNGSRDDFEGYEGISHFIEHAVFKRSKNRTGKQIAVRFENMGAYFNAFTEKEFTCFYVRALKKHFRRSLELLTEVVFSPSFTQTEIESEKKVIIEEIKSIEDDAEELIFDMADKQLYSGNSMDHPIAGSIDSVKNTTKDKLIEFHRQQYSPENIVVSLTGSIPHKRALRVIEEFFSDAVRQGIKSTRNEPIVTEPSIKIIEKPYHQDHILLSARTEGISSCDRYPLAIFNILFGDGMSSRLYQKLRERNSLVYAVYCSLLLNSDCGSFHIYSATDPENSRKTEKLIFDEIKRAITKKIPLTEINRSKEQLKTGIILELEGLSSRMQNLAKNEFIIGKQENIEDTLKEVDAVTQDRIMEVIEKYLAKDKWHRTILKADQSETE
jgi:predicted Zn-dependent peptidase